jgi:hypothetical protein
MVSVRVFTSFDLDHDEDLVDRLLVHSRECDLGFEIVARSEAGEMTERWSEGLGHRIDEVDQMIVICGEHSGTSERMSAELAMARQRKKPYFLLWGRRECVCTKPVGAKNDDGMYRWTWATLREQSAVTLRNFRPPDVPGHDERSSSPEPAHGTSPFSVSAGPGRSPRVGKLANGRTVV